MSKPLTSLGNFLGRKPVASASAHVGDGTDVKWTSVPNPRQALLQELQQLYWNGVRRELIEIIFTLKTWQHADFDKVALSDETDQEIYGFDTFLDQVIESSRDFASQYSREKAREMKRTATGEYVPMDAILQSIARQFRANQQSKALKKEIKEALDARIRDHNVLKRRARMLLLSAGWLDLDKFIEHRPPLDELSFWKRPTTPQLWLERFYNDYTPLFQPLLCAICTQVIRGSYFECLEKHCTKNRAGSLCQDCQNASKHQHQNLRKRYKHCILTESIDASTSRKICKCGTVPRHDTEGRSRSVYPVHATDKHRSTPKGTVQCGLLDLTSLVAEAKFENVVLKVDKRSTLEEEKRLAHEEAKRREQQKAANQYQRQTATETVDEKEAGEDIPFFMRKITDRYPFGNVHMALRVGPIIIENGVRHSKGGAIITSRDPPIWQSSGGSDRSIAYALALSEDRSLYSQVRDQRKPKRYKTALKQVVGGLFGGFFSQDLEAEVIDLVIAGSQKNLDDEDESPRNNKKLLNSVLEPIIQRLVTLMKPRVDIMLQSITQRLLDTRVKLHWDQKANNCQNFCDSLIDYQIYGGFMSDSSEINPLGVDPLYLMSFVCRPESYRRERRVRTKFDVPSGLCEEYLLKFRYGFHVDSDIIDTLQEYWYDWGAFGCPLYRYQQLFPWDCTEAYGRSSTKCNDCNISKHVWSFPFDSWSIAELHLTRGRLMYPDITSEQEWMENRMMVILAQTTLVTAAKAMAESITFRNATSWIAKHTDPRMDRIKLGGIHRAQPFSHQYENGKYHEYFIADWAHLQREDQIAEYEDIREARRQLPDVPETSGGYKSGLEGAYSQSPSYDDYRMEWAMFGPYYDSGWDGTYDQNETLTPDQLALIGMDDDGTADAGGDSGGGGDGGGGDGGDSGGGGYGGDSGGGGGC